MVCSINNKKFTWTVQIQNKDATRMQHKVIICDRIYIDCKEEYTSCLCNYKII